jgi:hypothetical protein
VRRVHLEGAVVCPKIHRGCNAGYTALVDHLSCLCATNRELEIGIFLPISKEQWELVQKAVVDVAHQLDGRGTRVPGDAALEFGRAGDENFPLLELVLILDLYGIN